MTISGKIIYVFPLKTGKFDNGDEWVLKNYLVEEVGKPYPQRVMFCLDGWDDILYYRLQLGEFVTVWFDMTVKRRGDNFYNVAVAYKVKKMSWESLEKLKTVKKRIPKNKRNKDLDKLPF